MVSRLNVLMVLLLFVRSVVADGPGPGPMQKVSVAQASIQVNENGVTRTIGRVPRGTLLWVLSTQGDYFEVVDPGSRKTGWVLRRHTQGIVYSKDVIDQLWVGIRANNAAVSFYEKGDYAAAEPQHRRALAIREKLMGAEHPHTAHSYFNLAGVYFRQGNYAAAKPLYQRALTINERMLGPEHPFTLEILGDFGLLFLNQGDYETAERHLRRALRSTESVRGSEDADTAKCLNGLAVLYRAQGDFAGAEALYQRALRIQEKTPGPDHPDTAVTLGNLAELHWAAADYAAAEALYQRAIRIQEKALGPDDAALATSLTGLALAYKYQKKYSAAEPLYQRALTIREKALGKKHPDTAESLNNLGTLHDSQGNYATATTYLQRALSIWEDVFGPEHPDTAIALNNLAWVHWNQGDAVAATPLFQRALKIRERFLGRDHPNTAQSLSTLATLLESKNQTAEAAKRFDQERRSVTRHVSRVLPMLAEREQELFLATKFKSDDAIALSFGLKHAAVAPYSKLSAAWLLNGKGIAQESLGQRNLLTRDVSDPRLGPTVKSLLRVRGQLAQLSMTTPDPKDLLLRQQQMAELTATERRLTRELGTAGADLARSHREWVELDDVRRSLPENAVLIDIARFDVFDFSGDRFNSDRLPARYVAWITYGAGSGETKVVDLGIADAIDELVQRVRIMISEAATGHLSRYGEEDSTNLLKKELTALAARVWQPIESHLNSIDNIVLSPDGALWLAPWNALPVGSQTDDYLIEHYGLRFVTSGRDLVRKPVHRSARSPVILANPAFDQAAEEKRASIKAIFNTLPPADEFSTRSFSARNLLPRVAPLPNTGAEAEAIRPNVEKFTRGKVRVYEERYALERVAKALKSPQVATFATHGFFLPTQTVKTTGSGLSEFNKLRSVVLDGDSRPIENPLLRCGLLFSGCNNREAIVGDDDGILTGLEIVGIDFRGTDLVVLSACETGVGDIRNGEGVAGLRQAFLLAGTQSVVSSLWNVADEETARLMSEFFKNLADGMNKSESLRQAQLTRIKARRERYGAAHPFFWAAFTLTGRE